MLTRTSTIRTVILAVTVVAGGLIAVPVAAQPFDNCPNDEPPYIDVASCNFGVGPQIGDDPFEFDIPAGGGGNNCIRPNGVDNDSSAADLDKYGPRDIVCDWTGVGPYPHNRGRYSSAWDCYLFRRSDLRPADDMVGYTEELAEDGLVYLASCFPPPNAPVRDAATPSALAHWHTCPCGAEPDPDGAQWGGLGDYVVLDAPPPFDPPQPSVLDVWADAVSQLDMYGPAITTAPPIDTATLVFLPAWLWTEETELRWPEEPLDAEASEGPWTVEAWAEPQRIKWDMGDGGQETCDRPGVAWRSGMDFLVLPAAACTYAYERPSRDEPGGVFEIVAITTWRVWWNINGEFDNEVEIQVGTTATYRVDELQVLTRR